MLAKNLIALSEVFHISIFGLAGVELSCLCGDLTDLLPLTILSSGALVVRYNKIGLPTDDSNVQGFSAAYKFRNQFHGNNSYCMTTKEMTKTDYSDLLFVCSFHLIDCAQTTRSRTQGILYVALRRNLTSSEYVHVQCDWTIEVSSKHYLSIDVRLLDSPSRAVVNKSSSGLCFMAKSTLVLYVDILNISK